MFLIIFSTILLFLNIVMFLKKKYLYLFVPCILFLPEFYGIEFSESFPIFTVSRMMYIVFFIYVLINHRRSIKFSMNRFNEIPNEYFFIFLYFILRIITNLYYISAYSDAIKTLFEIVFEQLFFLVGIYMLAPSKKETINIINIVSYTAAVFFLIGIFESITGIRPFDNLYTVSRYMLNDHYVRLGFLRSTTTFGLANLYGSMCILTLPLILYMYTLSHKRRYIFFAALDFLAIVHSGCRYDMFLFFIIIIGYFIGLCIGAHRKKEFLSNSLIAVTITVLFVVISSLISPYSKYYYSGTAKSLLNEVGFEFDLNEGSPEGVSGYGRNSVGGGHSRILQFTAVDHALHTNALFGQGSGAAQRHEVMVFTKGAWKSTSTIDVGFIEVLILEGIIGFIGFISIFVYLLMISIKNHVSVYDKRFLLLLIATYLFSLLSSVNMYHFLLLYIVIINTFSNNKESEISK